MLFVRLQTGGVRAPAGTAGAATLRDRRRHDAASRRHRPLQRLHTVHDSRAGQVRAAGDRPVEDAPGRRQA